MGRLIARAFWSPKRDAAPTEWEDACAYSEGRGLFAVADGASSSYRARDWAMALVDGFLATPPARLDEAAVRAWIDGLAEQWSGLAAPKTRNDAWYVDEVSRRGAFATFLGLKLTRRRTGADWSATAIGDSCLFHLRHNLLLTAFPLTHPSQFTLTPALVPTET